MKRKLLCLVLALLMTLSGLPLSVAAAGEMRFAFELSANGKKNIYVCSGDIITVTLALNRTDGDQPYTLYAMQDEICYDSDFFELVDMGVDSSSGIVAKDMDAGKGRRELYMNYLSMTGGTPKDARMTVGWFRLRVKAETGTSVISNGDYLVSLRDGSGSYPCTAEDLTVTVSDSRTVRFETNTDRTVPDQSVLYGAHARLPEGLSRANYTLCGWYEDPEFNRLWDFGEDVVTDNMTLYARWLENEIDQEDRDTGICIELPEDSHVYTGKAIKPEVIVWDDGRILTEGQDYTLAYRNNTNACRKDDPAVALTRRPQLTVQGKGNYRSVKKITRYFTIEQRAMADLTVTLPEGVVTKGGAKAQSLRVTVSTGTTNVAASAYTIHYYTDEALSREVAGILEPGRYYVVLEAQKTGDAYTGNYRGLSRVYALDAAPAPQMLTGATLTAAKNIVAVQEQPDAETAIRALVSKVTMNRISYLTEGENLRQFLQLFEVTAVDADGSFVEQENLGKLLLTTGKKTVTVRGREGNPNGFAGGKSLTVQVKGTALNRKQFLVTFGEADAAAVTRSDYSGIPQVPDIFTELQGGRDYTVTFRQGKNGILPVQIREAGSYTMVITGAGSYSGTISVPFTIAQADLAGTYADGRLRVGMEASAVYSPDGAKPTLALYYTDAAGREQALTEGVDYTLTYSGNKAITDKAAVTVKGKGSFRGSLTQKAAPELVFTVEQKSLAAEDISVVVTGVTVRQGVLQAVKYSVYDGDKKIATNQYTGRMTDSIDSLGLLITGAGKLYAGSRRVELSRTMISVTDAKQVKLSLPKNIQYYYTGSTIRPQVLITDAEGNDLTDCVRISYGTNTGIGSGTVTVTGRPELGYFGSKTLRFTILPKWMEWLLG